VNVIIFLANLSTEDRLKHEGLVLFHNFDYHI
jgi:hypothetical protein